MRRGHGLSFTLGSQLLRLTESAGLVCRFNWARTLTLRRSTKVVATLTDKQCPQVCAFRGLTNYNSETYNSMMSRCNRTKVDYRGLSPIGSLSSIRLLRWCALQWGYSSVILILPKQYISKYGLRGLFKWLHYPIPYPTLSNSFFCFIQCYSIIIIIPTIGWGWASVFHIRHHNLRVRVRVRHDNQLFRGDIELFVKEPQKPHSTEYTAHSKQYTVQYS